jgi:hypothetical protein
MSWWDFATDFASNAWDFAKANPTVTGAVIGGLANKDNRLAGAALGAGVGYGLSNFAPGTFGGGAYEPPSFNFGTGPSQSSYGTLGTGAPQISYAPTQGASQFAASSMTPTAGMGTYSPVADIAGYNNMSVAPTSGYGNTGITGDFGNLGRTQGGTNAVESMLGDVRGWGQRNPNTASALVQGAGMLIGRNAQKDANRLMERDLALREQQQGQQQQQFARQNQQADYWNTQARQSADEARSLYNPQELGIRGMAQQTAATGRRVQELDKLSSKGWSQADINAEKRRAKVAGSAASTTGYMAGLDVGRQAQGGALSSAKGLSQGYGAAPTPVDMSDQYNARAKQGEMTTQSMTSLLERYLGDPTKQQQEDAARSKGVLQA